MLGFGRIGQQVARRAPASACASSRYDPSSPPTASASSASSASRRTDDVYAAAEFLTLHLPLTPETRGSLDARRSRRCATACRSSTRRAASWSTRPRSSTRSARQGRRRGARRLLEEPYSGPLLELDNVVVTPHLAASTDEAQDRAGVIVAEQVAAALDGGLVTNAVNIPVIGAEELEALGPYIPLAAKLGRIAMELAGGRAEESR